MKFLCPCCGVKVVPYEEDDEPRLSSNSAVNTDRFLSKNFDENDNDEDFTTALREVIVDTMGKSKGDPSTSGMANGNFIRPSIPLLLFSWLQPMDNLTNPKLFSSTRAVEKEQTRHKEAGWIIHPCSLFRVYWNLLMLTLLIMNMFALPVVITFFTDDMPLSWTVLNIISDVFFLADLVLNFRTGVIVNDVNHKIILEPRKIVIIYLRTWFLIDLLSSLPLDYIISVITRHNSHLIGASRALRLLRLAKLLSLLRLLRISRLVRYISQYEVIFNWTKSCMRFIHLVTMLSLIIHWNACLQYIVPSFNDFPTGSWVTIHGLRNETLSTKYIWSWFKAMSHMLCIGFGRYPPQTVLDVIVTSFSMITGATCYGICLAYCIAAIQQTDSSRRHYRERVQQLAEYMSYRKLPNETRDKVMNYFDHRYKGKFFNERDILSEVSSPLRLEIISHNCRDLVKAVPFFKQANPLFVSAIITKLSFEVFLAGDVIIEEGTAGTEMYFLQEGCVEVRTNNVTQGQLKDGSYFGEICLLTNTRRITSVVAMTICDTFVLSKGDFHDVLDDFPEMRATMETVAEERLKEIKATRTLKKLTYCMTEIC